jgi:hypothetical protein
MILGGGSAVAWLSRDLFTINLLGVSAAKANEKMS